MQNCGCSCYMISSSGGYDDVCMVVTNDSDIAEDDRVTVYGVTDGIYEYETVIGALKKISEFVAKHLDR